MRENSTIDLARKLLSIGIVLGTVSVSDMGSSTFAPLSKVHWTVADASTFRTPQKSRAAEIDLALSEVRSARAILGARELHREVAFGEYLGAIDSALGAYERAPTGAGKEVRLATALAVARTALLDSVARLSSWTAIVRSTGHANRFTSVPDRFIAAPSPLAHDDDLHRDAAVETWLDLASMGV
jgi:hypothetical protein